MMMIQNELIKRKPLLATSRLSWKKDRSSSVVESTSTVLSSHSFRLVFWTAVQSVENSLATTVVD